MHGPFHQDPELAFSLSETPSSMDEFIGPQNLQGYENGNYSDDAFDFLNPNHDIAWETPLNNEPAARSAASHLNWQQPTTSTPALEAYGRPFSRSPSAIQTTTPYGYGDPQQFTQSPYDPSLISQPSVEDNSSIYAGYPAYGQQTVQHGTIAPQALQHGQTHFPRSSGNPDNQVRSQAVAFS